MNALASITSIFAAMLIVGSYCLVIKPKIDTVDCYQQENRQLREEKQELKDRLDAVDHYLYQLRERKVGAMEQAVREHFRYCREDEMIYIFEEND